ncbi:uncharacterized protein LOC133178803 [Saccostrea echinata]|uniref:uncharacterized protein LOC133178803 n=1 Tax=Saccostrea echinata TaxID=191078 RepID=UPI002A83558B|nr:uncharacterized protein LOC133178803 [Saccostrea echinata]
MAASKSKYPLGSPQEHIQMCQKHDFPIDMVCEDCDVFICSTCAKSDHNGHNWVTQATAAIHRKRELLKYLRKIKKEQLPAIDEKILKKKTENEGTYDSLIKKVQKQFDEIVARLTEIKKSIEEALKGELGKKNKHLENETSRIEKKKKNILEIVEYLEENNSSMSDKNLIENHRDLTHLLDDLDIDLENCSIRFRGGEIDVDLLESMFGQIFNIDDISAKETNSFQYGEHPVLVSEALSEDECYIRDGESDFIELVNRQGEKKQKFTIDFNDMCVTTNGIYFTLREESTICYLSSSGSISELLSTDPLVPLGIFNSLDSGFFVSLQDSETDDYPLESHSRRLVKYLTLTGDVIHEYEYQEDGQTRLFTLPGRLCQNFNSDICVMNITSDNAGEIVIVSVSGRLRSSYLGQNLNENFFPVDLVCDSTYNILVIDPGNSLIHLLSPKGEFLKYLLTEKEISPSTLTLCRSALWMGTAEGLVKVFKYKSFP